MKTARLFRLMSKRENLAEIRQLKRMQLQKEVLGRVLQSEREAEAQLHSNLAEIVSKNSILPLQQRLKNQRQLVHSLENDFYQKRANSHTQMSRTETEKTAFINILVTRKAYDKLAKESARKEDRRQQKRRERNTPAARTPLLERASYRHGEPQ